MGIKKKLYKKKNYIKIYIYAFVKSKVKNSPLTVETRKKHAETNIKVNNFKIYDIKCNTFHHE